MKDNKSEIEYSIKNAIVSLIELQDSICEDHLWRLRSEFNTLERIFKKNKLYELSHFVEVLSTSLIYLDEKNMTKIIKLYIVSLNSIEQKLLEQTDSYDEFLYQQIKEIRG